MSIKIGLQLLKVFLMRLRLQALLNHWTKLLLSDTNLLHHTINKALHHLLEFLSRNIQLSYLMQIIVREFVLLLIIKDYTMFIKEFWNGQLPRRWIQVLKHKLIYPILQYTIISYILTWFFLNTRSLNFLRFWYFLRFLFILHLRHILTLLLINLNLLVLTLVLLLLLRK